MFDTLPSYKSHKTVRAAPILWVSGEMAGACKVTLDVDGERIEVAVSPDVFARGRPQPQDYLVSYDDGRYVSWSPKLVFDAGYVREDGPAPKRPSPLVEQIDRFVRADRRTEWRPTEMHALLSAALVNVDLALVTAAMEESKVLRVHRDKKRGVTWKVVEGG